MELGRDVRALSGEASKEIPELPDDVVAKA